MRVSACLIGQWGMGDNWFAWVVWHLVNNGTVLEAGRRLMMSRLYLQRLTEVGYRWLSSIFLNGGGMACLDEQVSGLTLSSRPGMKQVG